MGYSEPVDESQKQKIGCQMKATRRRLLGVEKGLTLDIDLNMEHGLMEYCVKHC